jgi:tripartite ATP-independent transporter DctP family solute receptor
MTNSEFNMSRRAFTRAGGALLLVGLAAPALAACAGGNGSGSGGSNTATLKLGYNSTSDYPHGQIMERFAKNVAKQSGGEMKIQTFPDATLGDETQMLEGIQLGSLDMAKASTSVLASVVPAFGAFDLPYLFRDKDHLMGVLNGDIGADLLDRLEAKGLKGLYWMEQGTRNFYTVDHPINGVDDLRGLKIRTIEAPVMIDTINALGASATPLPFSELYVAMQTHVVDGAENSPDALVSAKHHELIRHYAATEHFRTPVLVYMSGERWNGLAKDQQAVITDAAAEATEWGADLYEQEAATALEAMKQAGVQITEPDLEPFRQATETVYDKHADSIGADLIDAIRAS